MVFFWNLTFLTTITVVCSTRLQQSEAVNVENDVQLKTISSVTQFLQDTCNCETNFACQCCARYDNNFINVHQKLCGNVTVNMKDFQMTSEVILNNAVLFSNTFSGSDIPPYCFPIMTVPPIFGCIKAHSLKQHDNNQFHVCGNATLSVIGFRILNFQMGCVDFGTEGIKLVEPDHDTVGDNGEGAAEISLEIIDTLAEITPASAKNKIFHEEEKNEVKRSGALLL